MYIFKGEVKGDLLGLSLTDKIYRVESKFMGLGTSYFRTTHAFQ